MVRVFLKGKLFILNLRCLTTISRVILLILSCFTHKRNGRTKRSGAVQFSSDPMNLANINSYKFSGTAPRAVGIEQGEDSKGHSAVILKLRSTKKANKPSKSIGKSVMKKNIRAVGNSVNAQVTDAYYRPDLKDAALKRVTNVHRAVRIRNKVIKPMPTKQGRGSLKK